MMLAMLKTIRNADEQNHCKTGRPIIDEAINIGIALRGTKQFTILDNDLLFQEAILLGTNY